MSDFEETIGPDDATVLGENYSSQTIGDVELSDFLRHQARCRVAGVMSPIKSAMLDRWEVDSPEFVVGRDSKCDLTLSDDAVSRRHAIIRKTDNDEFFIEDLGSSNGTYVDGVPIVCAQLQSGDGVQIGRNLFIFDRILQFIDDDDFEDGGF